MPFFLELTFKVVSSPLGGYMISDETTLVIRLPSDLKGSFQGLCKARGVTVSEELRRFIADTVSNAATGMTTRDRQPSSNVTKKAVSDKNRGSSRCDSTSDMFADNDKTLLQPHTSLSGTKPLSVGNDVLYDATGARIRQPSNGINSKAKGKTSQKAKKR